MFGDSERKGTCLWLKNLPELVPTKIVEPKIIKYKNGKGTDSPWHMETMSLPPAERSKMRSKTFPGIAKAMAEQWAGENKERSKNKMELRVNEVTLPEQITFNYEELKAELTEKVSMYTNLVYTDEQIKEAKADKANLNKLKKALNDERIRREKEYMIPFNDFKAKINEIISIIDKPIAVIDTQVKAYEDKQKQDKLASIQEYYNSIEKPELQWLGLPAIYDEKWLNATVSMKSIHETINSRLEQIKNDLDTLADLPEFGFEATEVYKSTLDINKALNEGRRLAEIAKKKAEHEAEMKAREEERARLAAEKEAWEQAEREAQKIHDEEAQFATEIIADGVPTTHIPPAKQWVSFSALLSTEDAFALKEFFSNRNIEFKAI